MKKISQNRGAWNKYITEPLNEAFSDKAKKFVSPKYEETLSKLTETDDSIREDAAPLKELIKSARSNFSRREYITCVVELGKFHEALDNIVDKLKNFRSHLTGEHEEFLFNGLDPEQLDYLSENLHNRFTSKNPKINRLADLTDTWVKLADDRVKGLKLLEKGFGKDLKDFKKSTENLLLKSELIYNKFISSLKLLDRARSKRNLNDYDNISIKLIKEYDLYHTFFKSYYLKNMMPFIENQRKRKAAEEARMDEQIEGVRALQNPNHENVLPSESKEDPFANAPLPLYRSKIKGVNGPRAEFSPPKFNEDEYTAVNEDELIFDKDTPEPSKEAKIPPTAPKQDATKPKLDQATIDKYREPRVTSKPLPSSKPSLAPPTKKEEPKPVEKKEESKELDLKGGIGKK